MAVADESEALPSYIELVKKALESFSVHSKSLRDDSSYLETFKNDLYIRARITDNEIFLAVIGAVIITCIRYVFQYFLLQVRK